MFVSAQLSVAIQTGNSAQNDSDGMLTVILNNQAKKVPFSFRVDMTYGGFHVGEVVGMDLVHAGTDERSDKYFLKYNASGLPLTPHLCVCV